jgi:hypothetical protein
MSSNVRAILTLYKPALGRVNALCNLQRIDNLTLPRNIALSCSDRVHSEDHLRITRLLKFVLSTSSSAPPH